MPIERKDIISDDAIQSPLVMAENFEQMKKTLQSVYDLADSRKGSLEAATTINEVKKEVSALTVEQKELEKIQNQISVANAKNTETYRAYEEELKRIKKESKEVAEGHKQNAKEATAENSSIKQLGAALAKNKQQYAELTSAQARNSKEGKALLKTIQQQDKDFKQLSNSIGTTQVNVGNYTGAIKSALAPLSAFGLNIGQIGVGAEAATGALKSAAVGANIFRTALLAIPIIALVTAIISLVSYFTKTQEGAEKLRIAFAVFEEIVDTVVDTFVDLGKALTELTWDEFTKGVEDFGKAVVKWVLDKIILVIDGFSQLGDALALLFEGEFRKSAEVAGKALLQIVKNGTPIGLMIDATISAAEKFAEVAVDAYKSVNEAIQAGLEIGRRQNKLIEDRRNFIIIEARLQKESNEAREKAADAALSDQIKLNALLLASAKLRELNAGKIKLVQDELDILMLKEADKFARGKAADEADIQRKVELEAQILQMQGESAAEQRKLTAQISALKIKIITDEKNARLKAIAEEQAALDDAARKEVQRANNALNNEVMSIKQRAIDGVITRKQADEEILKAQKQFGAAAIGENIKQLRTMLENHAKFSEQELKVANLTEQEKIKIRVDNAKVQEGIEAELTNARIKLTDLFFDHVKDQEEKQVKTTEEKLAQIQEIYTEATNSIGALFSSLSDNRLADIAKEEQEQAASLERNLLAAGNNEEAKAKMRNDFAQKNSQLERKKAMEQRKAAVFDKAVSAVQAAIATALAVTKVLWNPPLAIATAAFGAAQVLAILSRQIPAFEEGGKHKGGLFIAGEKGKELVKEPSGKTYLTSNSAQLYSGPRGTEIFDAATTMKLLAMDGLKYNGGRKVSSKEQDLLKEVSKKLDALNKTIKNKPNVAINFSRAGAEAIIANAETRTKLLNDFFR